MADILLAAPNAKFGQPEVNIGTITGGGGSQRLARAVGKSRAMELVLTGRMWSAQEAAAWGMASRVVGGGEGEGEGEGEGDGAAVVREAVALAGEIAGKSQIAVQVQKEAINASTFGVTQFPLPGYTTTMIHFYICVCSLAGL
jgi:enoyl-CoA hydratase